MIATTNFSPQITLDTSRQFTAWLAEQNLSLTFTTYQAGKLFLLGLNPTGELSVFERNFPRCMGLCATKSSLYLSSLYQVWRLENLLESGQLHNGYDALYVPQVGYITGDLDIHDLTLGDAKIPLKNFQELQLNEHQPIFVNTLFSCLATISETHSFVPLWQPPFISKLAAEDRCHLNGLGMRDGQPRYVTAVSQSDVADGWREKRTEGGCVIDVSNNEVIASGLSMPHSPRWYQDKLWLLNSGTGELGYVDTQRGKFEPVSFCPGYLRGLAFSGEFAIIGLSQPRGNKTFSGLPLDEKLAQKNAEPRCGLMVIDLRTGDSVHWLRMGGLVEELYDVAVLPEVRRPMALGFRTDEIRRVIRF